MVVELANRLVKRNEEQDAHNIFSQLQVWQLNKLIHALEMNAISLARKQKYIVIELPNDQVPQSTLRAFYELQLLGYVPIIVGVESNLYLRKNLKMLREFVRQGVLIHVNAANLIGASGKKTQKYALGLCKKKVVHIVYSGTDYFNDPPFLLKDTYQFLRKKVSHKYVAYLKENEKRVEHGLDFHDF